MASTGASGNQVRWRVADVTARNAIVVAADEVGYLVRVLSGSGELYPAITSGSGAGVWGEPLGDSTAVSGAANGTIQTYTRTFAFDDVEIDVAALTASVDIGDTLPAGAIVLAVIADVTVDWTDGGAGVFSADVGISGGDADLFTPTALDIDGGIALLTQTMAMPGGGEQLAVTFDGDVNLSTLTAGSMDLTVLFCVPAATAV